jgi:hypothetical protein
MRSAHTFGISPGRLAADTSSSGARHLLALQSAHRDQAQMPQPNSPFLCDRALSERSRPCAALRRFGGSEGSRIATSSPHRYERCVRCCERGSPKNTPIRSWLESQRLTFSQNVRSAESNHRSLASDQNRNFSVKFWHEESWAATGAESNHRQIRCWRSPLPTGGRVCALTQRTEASYSRELSKVAVDKWFAIQVADSSG